MIKNNCVGRCRWVISELMRRRGDPISDVAGELPPHECFGPMREPDRLILERFLAGHRPAKHGAPDQPCDPEST